MPPRTQPRKGPKFLEMKILIGALAIAVTIGLWNLFSNSMVALDGGAGVAPAPSSGQPPQPVVGSAEGFPPLPTLAPLYEVSGQPAQTGQPAVAVQQPDQPAVLRQVAVPTQVIVQKFKPVVSGGFTSQPAAGGSGGGSSPAPVTVTASSRP